MSPNRPPEPGGLHPGLIDNEIAHIRRVMPLSLSGDLAGPIFPASYWRRRLIQLLDAGHVTKGQLAQIDSLLLQLDEFERRAAEDATPPKPVVRSSSGA